MYQKILIPLDGSELAECSLDHAKAIAQGCRVSDVIIFRAMEPLPLPNLPPMAEAGGGSIRRDIEQEQQEAKDYVLQIQNKLKAEGMPSRAVTVEGAAADEILSYAEQNNIDLIVMSTHGRSGPSRFFFGSVSEKVSRYSRIPVLLISPEGCRKVGNILAF
jgi:nucleotide-binding universal stress UspA family protein